jgi:hypothetical protein
MEFITGMSFPFDGLFLNIPTPQANYPPEIGGRSATSSLFFRIGFEFELTIW